MVAACKVTAIQNKLIEGVDVSLGKILSPQYFFT